VSLARRVYRLYKASGPHAVVTATRDEIKHRLKWYSPKLSWARLGPVSRFVAETLKPQAPPLLILSMPRSGSSWVGETLGRAQNALYLLEPMNLSCNAYFHQVGHEPKAVFEVDSSVASEVFARAARKAFSGLPAFPRLVVRFPDQWDLFSRQVRRLVIKEVNPMACEWLVERYQARVILLVRHPAAVALSYANLGWLHRPIPRKFGEFQGAAQRAALDGLMAHPEHAFVTYEDLCADPTGVFRSLHGFAEMTWDSKTESYIRGRSSGQDPAGRCNPYGTLRDSRSMIRAWVGQLSTEELENLRAGYSSFDLPWYRAAEDWS
jgi:hypothetical protein